MNFTRQSEPTEAAHRLLAGRPSATCVARSRSGSGVFSGVHRVCWGRAQDVFDRTQAFSGGAQVFFGRTQVISDGTQVISDRTQLVFARTQSLCSRTQVSCGRTQSLSSRTQVSYGRTQVFSGRARSGFGMHLIVVALAPVIRDVHYATFRGVSGDRPSVFGDRWHASDRRRTGSGHTRRVPGDCPSVSDDSRRASSDSEPASNDRWHESNYRETASIDPRRTSGDLLHRTFHLDLPFASLAGGAHLEPSG